MEPFFKKAVTICQKILLRNHLDGNQLTKLILVGGPTYSPYLRQMLREKVSPNVDTSVDPMTAVAKGATLYAATRDIPADLMAAPDADAIEIEMHYDTMSTDLIAFLAIKIKDKRVMTEGMTVEVVRGDGAWSSGKVPYEDSGIVIDISLAEHTANNFTVRFTNDFGHNVKVTPNNLTILQGLQVSAAPLPYHIGFGVWDEEDNRQEFVPFLGLEKSKPVPAHGVANGRKTTMRLVPNDETTYLKIPVYQSASYVTNSPADLYEHVADLIITGKDIEHEIPAGTEVEVQVSVDSSEMMKFEIFVPKTEETIEKTLDTTPRFNSQDANALIVKYAEHARQTLDMLESENVAVEVLKNRLYALRSSRRHTETKAIVEQYKELLRDIYRLECDTAWERIIRKVEKEMALLKLAVGINGDDHSKYAFHYLEVYIESAKENQDVAAAKKILEEVELLSLDLRWKVRIPNLIKWYDRNFDNVEWSDKEHGRWCIDQALELIGKEFTKEEVLKALRRIQSARESLEEIREAEGLLG
jgi:molecular chaperone DnaK